MLTVVCYYTNDMLYTKHMLALKLSAERFGLNFKADKKNKEDWISITGFKPCFIKNSMETIRGKILYIDADALILGDIAEYFESIQEDIAVHYLDDRELLSGTIFFNETDGARLIINEWIKEQKNNPKIWDQKNLQQVLWKLKAENKITIKKIPEYYTQIFDRYNHNTKPLIEHYQASRDVKWRNKYTTKNFFYKKMMLTSLKTATRRVKNRHAFFNKKCYELGVDIKLCLSDLIEK